MKGKKGGAFSNTATGYGKATKTSNSKCNNNNNNSCNKFGKTINSDKKVEKEPNENLEQNDDDLNSGFGDYLRSSEAVEMMKLFVFANSIMLVLTMAWPNLKENYYMLMHWWFQQLNCFLDNMVAPLMQGLLLMGIIYWYSKGMMSLINDYYRSEFQRKLKTEDTHNSSLHVMDDIDSLIRTENLLREAEKPSIEVVTKLEVFEFCKNPKIYEKFVQLLEEYLKLSRKRDFLEANAICLTDTLESNANY